MNLDGDVCFCLFQAQGQPVDGYDPNAPPGGQQQYYQQQQYDAQSQQQQQQQTV
jgi:hypothetical protein